MSINGRPRTTDPRNGYTLALRLSTRRGLRALDRAARLRVRDAAERAIRRALRREAAAVNGGQSDG